MLLVLDFHYFAVTNMGIKSLLARPFASTVVKKLEKQRKNAVRDQKDLFQFILSRAQITQFGKDHEFEKITSHYEFTQNVPIRDYEELRPYISKIIAGEKDVLWRGNPAYFAKTSGTTSGAKFIPISKDSLPNHMNTARDMLLNYIHLSKEHSLADGKMIFLSGSPTLEETGGIKTGRLSGIVNHHVPNYLRKNQLPSYDTNCIEEWEDKLDKIVEETIEQDMRLISGIPPWVQMYFDRLQEKSGKTIIELFPNLKVLAHGGVNIQPYKSKLFTSLGTDKVQFLETFPASEGFFAFQDNLEDEGLLLNTNSGIFYEFIPLQEIDKENPKRITLGEVELDKNYALIINSNAGLWGYNIGDTVKFVSLDPYRIVVSGRIKHFISAFGEHVIGEEVEHAMRIASEKHNVSTIEFTVAPYISSDKGASYHEWFVSFEQAPDNMQAFAKEIDNALRKKNIYYEDLVGGGILKSLVITPMKKNAFQEYMKSIGKLGGQNKVPRLSNDRNIAEALKPYVWQS